MTLIEIENAALFACGEDGEALSDHQPYLRDAVNRGYDLLLSAAGRGHLHEEVMPLHAEKSTPELPQWAHAALVDYAAAALLRLGSPEKVQRASLLMSSFRESENRLRREQSRAFVNLPK